MLERITDNFKSILYSSLEVACYPVMYITSCPHQQLNKNILVLFCRNWHITAASFNCWMPSISIQASKFAASFTAFEVFVKDGLKKCVCVTVLPWSELHTYIIPTTINITNKIHYIAYKLQQWHIEIHDTIQKHTHKLQK